MPRYAPETVMVLPDEDEDWRFNFTRVTRITTDVIVSAEVTIDPSGPTVGTPSVVSGGLKVDCRIYGFTAGETYTVSCLVTRTSGRKTRGDVYFQIVTP